MTGKIKLNAASGGGSVSFQAPSSTGDDRVITLPTTADGTVLTTTNPKSGNIIQFVKVTQESVVSWNTTSFTDISGLTATINGVSSGSKIIVDFCLCLGRSHNTHAYFNLMRDSTGLEAYSGAGFTWAHYIDNSTCTYDFEIINLKYVDTHGQSAGSNLVYKLQGHNNSSTNYVQYLNRRNYDSTQRGGCLMTLTEVAG